MNLNNNPAGTEEAHGEHATAGMTRAVAPTKIARVTRAKATMSRREGAPATHALADETDKATKADRPAPASKKRGGPRTAGAASLVEPSAVGKARKAARKHKTPASTKTDGVLNLLRSARGASIAAIAQSTGWQPHSVRGFLSGHVKKKLGLTVTSEVGKDGVRRYRVADTENVG